MVAFKTDKSKDISCVFETYLKMHVTQDQKLCSGQTLGAVMVPSDQKEKIYTPLIRSSAIPLSKNPLKIEQLIVTAMSDQDETIYTVIPSRHDPLHNELVATPSDQEEGIYVELDQEDYIPLCTESDLEEETIFTDFCTSLIPFSGQENALYEEITLNQNETTYTESCSSESEDPLCTCKAASVFNPLEQDKSMCTQHCSSAISSSEDPLCNELIVTQLDQDKICSNVCIDLIPSKRESVLSATPSDQYETMCAPPCSSVIPSIEDCTSHFDQTISAAQSSHSRNEGIVSSSGCSTIAPVLEKYNSQMKSVNASCFITLKEGHTGQIT